MCVLTKGAQGLFWLVCLVSWCMNEKVQGWRRPGSARRSFCCHSHSFLALKSQTGDTEEDGGWIKNGDAYLGRWKDERKEEDETQKWAAAGKLSFLRAILPETHCGRSKEGTRGYKSVWRHAGEKAVTTPQRAMINSCTLKIAHIIMHSSPQELPLCKCAALIKAEWEQLGLIHK